MARIMYNRVCPNCQQIINYQSYGGWHNANKRNSNCRKCASELTGFTEKYATKGRNTGKDNAFFGKTHNKQTKEKISRANTGRAISQERKEELKLTMSGQNNPMYGKNVYNTWVDKYGYQKANQLDEKRRKKWSKASTGKNNPMYGKPSPNGSGNGWKGWYKGVFFRSLRELSYLIKIWNKKWKTGETIVIPYKFNDRCRTYRPDFIVGKYIIEIKPKRLHNTPNIQAKTEAAIKFCKKINKIYKLIDCKILDFPQIEKLVNNNDIKFQNRYTEKYEQYKDSYCNKRGKRKL